MPLPRRKDDGTGGAPVLDIMKAHVRLFDVEEHTEPFTVTRKSDGSTFTLDPQFKCTVKVIDDYDEGTDNGATFFEQFKYKWVAKNEQWENTENSKLGVLTKVIKPGYFDDLSIPALEAKDLEGFEMHCRVKPKKHPTTGKVLGSTIDWETMKPLPTKAKVVAAAAEEDEYFSDIPF
jgi:hypothetical protein